MSYYFGPVFIKIFKLNIFLGISIHMFCCAYWRVKIETDLENLDAFLEAKSVDPEVYLLDFQVCFTLSNV